MGPTMTECQNFLISKGLALGFPWLSLKPRTREPRSHPPAGYTKEMKRAEAKAQGTSWKLPDSESAPLKSSQADSA